MEILEDKITSKVLRIGQFEFPEAVNVMLCYGLCYFEFATLEVYNNGMKT